MLSCLSAPLSWLLRVQVEEMKKMTERIELVDWEVATVRARACIWLTCVCAACDVRRGPLLQLLALLIVLQKLVPFEHGSSLQASALVMRVGLRRRSEYYHTKARACLLLVSCSCSCVDSLYPHTGSLACSLPLADTLVAGGDDLGQLRYSR